MVIYAIVTAAKSEAKAMKDKPKRIRRTFSAEFKQKVLADVQRGMSLSEVGRKYSVAPILISKWRLKFAEGNLVGTPSKREKELEKELDRYKKLLAEAHAEREFLKSFQERQRLLQKLDTSAINGLDWYQWKKDAK